MEEKIRAADAATSKILDHWSDAERILGGSHNGLGILSDAQQTGYRLSDARKAIERALAVYHPTAWTADADYRECGA